MNSVAHLRIIVILTPQGSFISFRTTHSSTRIAATTPTAVSTVLNLSMGASEADTLPVVLVELFIFTAKKLTSNVSQKRFFSVYYNVTECNTNKITFAVT